MIEPMTMQERLNRFEIAQETIGFRMAMLTSEIHEEKAKAAPDAGKIAALRAEFNAFADEQHALRPNDDAEIDRVLNEHCPIVKADFERARAVA